MPTTHISTPLKSPKKNIELVLEWNVEKVNQWLDEKKINSKIIESIQPCDGALLNQFFEMQSSCPEFFYSSISVNKTIPFREVALFGFQLKKLFNQEN